MILTVCFILWWLKYFRFSVLEADAVCTIHHLHINQEDVDNYNLQSPMFNTRTHSALLTGLTNL
jgi:hypothetical protein